MRPLLPRSPVAQLAEHPAVNRRVVGSSPTRGATDRYFSAALVRTVRICAAAQGGQVLLSKTTESLLDADDLGGLCLRDVGVQELLDFERPLRLYEVVPHTSNGRGNDTAAQ
jgi:class 3 adenylate cyclase